MCSPRLSTAGNCGRLPISRLLKRFDTIDICVPTPLRKTKDPDMSFVVAATEAIAEHLHPGLLVMLESTTYPGTTDELVLPRLRATGLTVGEDFFLCFSPERGRPWQSEIPDVEHSKGRWWHYQGLHRGRGSVLQTGARNRDSSEFHAGCRDGEAARKYVPHDQYRPS